ncbi:MAG TPA: hypothetical protein VFQ37_06025 [Mycobacterium sp.]|nr:hypothetical protein [Mycobacterium sp.]
MTTKRKAPVRRGDRRARPDAVTRTAVRRPADPPSSRRDRRQRGTAPPPGREPRPRSGPQNTATPRPDHRPATPKNTRQAKARAKARKAKAPKVVRVPLRERLIIRLASLDLRPRTLAAKVPFVVLIIGSLGLGLGITLWLSTDAAERSYQLGNIREQNRALLQQKEALERDVLRAQSAPALAEAARNLGMIPTRDTAHLVQDPAGNWVVIGSPKPADGAPPPPLNTKLPDEPLAPPSHPVEVPVRVSPGHTPGGIPTPDTQHLPDAGATTPGAPNLPPTGPVPSLAIEPPAVVAASPPAGVEQFGPPVVTTIPGVAG